MEQVQGMVACVSIATGNITDALKRKGMWNNTLMVWSGDKCVAAVVVCRVRCLPLPCVCLALD